MFARDLREHERRSFPKIQLMLQILRYSALRQMRSRLNVCDPKYEDAVIPTRMRNFSANLGSLSACLDPNEEMANSISLELPRGDVRIPPYTPFIAPKIAEPPWPAAPNEHTADVSLWRNNARGERRANDPGRFPPHAWLLYQLRPV